MRGTYCGLHMSSGVMVMQSSHSSMRPLANRANTCKAHKQMPPDYLGLMLLRMLV